MPKICINPQHKFDIVTINLHSSNEDFYSVTRREDDFTPSDEGDSYFHSDYQDSHTKTGNELTDPAAGELGDIKEEEEDYEKDFLPHLGLLRLDLSKIRSDDSNNNRIELREPFQIEVSDSGSVEESFEESDDDGIGLGEQIKRTKLKTIGYANLTIVLHFMSDPKEDEEKLKRKNQKKLKDEMLKIRTQISKQEYILKHAIAWNKTRLRFCPHMGVTIIREENAVKRNYSLSSEHPEDMKLSRKFFMCSSTRVGGNDC